MFQLKYHKQKKKSIHLPLANKQNIPAPKQIQESKSIVVEGYEWRNMLLPWLQEGSMNLGAAHGAA
jgi:hypothetical protein